MITISYHSQTVRSNELLSLHVPNIKRLQPLCVCSCLHILLFSGEKVIFQIQPPRVRVALSIIENKYVNREKKQKTLEE